MCIRDRLLTALGPFTGSIFATGATAMVLFIASRLLERMPSGIPSAVSFQPAFLLLVPGTIGPVSYTHLDVYKRQHRAPPLPRSRQCGI